MEASARNQHPAVLTAAVVAKPDPRLAGVPSCAFIELKEGKQVSPEEIIAYCSQHLARFKVPKVGGV